jgi:ribosomal protein S13
MGFEEARRRYLMGKFTRLNVGDFKMDSLTTDQLEDLVDELTAAQERGDLNLETEQGLTRLQEIVESYL